MVRAAAAPLRPADRRGRCARDVRFGCDAGKRAAMTLARLVMLLVLLQLPPAGFPPAAVGAADPAAVSPRRVTEGTLFWKTGQGQVAAPVLATDVEIRVTGMIARARVHQEFTNPAAEWAEGVYVFPLPDDAAVDHLRMRVGDRIIEGMIRERAAAKAAYTQARQQGQRASLVEQERPNVFTTSVANIPPGAAITIEIEYQQTVHYDAGEFRLRFPMVVGPRYLPGEPVAAAAGAGLAPDTDQVPDASRISPPVRPPDEGPINPVRLRVELDPGLPLAAVESSYHPIHTVPLGGDRHEITLAEQIVAADRDFELVWRPVAGAAPTAALLVEPTGRVHVRAPDGDATGGLGRASAGAARGDLRARPLGLDGRSLDRSGQGGVDPGPAPAHAGRHLQRHSLQPPHRQSLRRAAAGEHGQCASGRAVRRGDPCGRRHRDAPGARARARADGGRRPAPSGDLPDRRRGRQRVTAVRGDPRATRRSPPVHDRHRLGAEQPLHARGGPPGPRDVHLHRQPGRGAGQDGRVVPQGRSPGGGRHHAGAGRRRRRRAAARADPGSLPGRAGGRRAPGAHAARARERARPHGIDRVGPRGADPRGGRGRGALDPLGAAEDRRAARSAIGGWHRRRACVRR